MLEASHLLWTPSHLGLPSWMALGVWLAGKTLGVSEHAFRGHLWFSSLSSVPIQNHMRPVDSAIIKEFGHIYLLIYTKSNTHTHPNHYCLCLILSCYWGIA